MYEEKIIIRKKNKNEKLTAAQLIMISPKPKSLAQDIFLYSVSVSTTMKKVGNCLQGVRTALEGAGAVPKDFFDGLTDAYQAIERFQNNGDFTEINCDVEHLDLLPCGAIVIWDHGEGSDAKSGHISISTGYGYEMSDHLCVQNTTGNRPNTKEKYGKCHVFLHKNSYEYSELLTNFMMDNLNTGDKKLRAANISLLLSANLCPLGSSMRRLAELMHAYELTSPKDKEFKEKQKFVEFLKIVMKSDGKAIEDFGINAKYNFIQVFNLLEEKKLDVKKINRIFDSWFIDNLHRAYDEYAPEKGISAFMGKDGQCYMYEVNQNDKIKFAYNSRGFRSIGIVAALTQLLKEIEINAYLPKDKKDEKLGDKIISVMSQYDLPIGKILFWFYNKSLQMDKNSSEQSKKFFDALLKVQESVYDTMQSGSRKVERLKQAIKNYLNKFIKSAPEVNLQKV